MRIATSSPEEGLDFAASLLSSAVEAKLEASPNCGAEIGKSLARYMRFRYVGELNLAWEELVELTKVLDSSRNPNEQLVSQLQWVAMALGLPSANVAGDVPPEE